MLIQMLAQTVRVEQVIEVISVINIGFFFAKNLYIRGIFAPDSCKQVREFVVFVQYLIFFIKKISINTKYSTYSTFYVTYLHKF